MTGLLRWWLGPSLLRRVVFALLWAFLLVWCALCAKDYWTFKSQDFDMFALNAAKALGESLADADPADAASVTRVTEDVYNRLRRGSVLEDMGEMLFVVTETATGRQVYVSKALSAQLDPLIAAMPNGDEQHVQHVQIAGQAYWRVVNQTPRWRLVLLEPVISDAALLRWIGPAQLGSMLLAFPFVLLPICLAVWGGLRPLREFSARVAARDPADVSRLGLELRQAELKPLVSAFESLLEKARRNIDRERAFVQDAAHELRTPLAVIMGQAHALTGASGPEAPREAQAALERAVDRASHLVHQLLTLARVEGSPRTRMANLVEVVRQVLIAAAPAAAQRDIEVSLDSAERLHAQVDVEALFTITDNLLRNALAYCPNGARVELTLSASGPQACLAVRDDGPGIAAEDVPHLFDRFHRGRDVRASGSGLGLAIVRQAAQAMGGGVALEAGIDGRGAGFVVTFPAATSPADD